MTYDDAVLADAPFAYWKCEETAGTSLADSSGGARDASLTGTPTFATPGPGAGMLAIQWESGSYGVSATMGDNTWTFSCWLYLPAYPGAGTRLFSLSNNAAPATNQDNVGLYVNTDGTVTLYVYTGTNSPRITSSAPLALNK